MSYDTEFTSENRQKLKDALLYNVKLTFKATENSGSNISWQQAARDWGAGSSEPYSLHTYTTPHGQPISVFIAKTTGGPPSSFKTSGYRQGGGCLHFGVIFRAGKTPSGQEVSGVFFVIHSNSWGPYQKRFAQSGMTGALHSGIDFAASNAGAAIGGAMVGQTIIPIPGLGAAVGAGVGFAITNMTDRLSGDYLRYIG